MHKRLRKTPAADYLAVVADRVLTELANAEEDVRLFRPTGSYPTWAATVELPEAIVELVASDLGTSVLSNWALQTALAEGRIAGAQVTEEGITVPCCAGMRSEDMIDEDPIRQVAELLAEWCAQPEFGFHLT